MLTVVWLLPSVFCTTSVLLPEVSVVVVVTVPSCLVSTTSFDPSGFLVVSVTVPSVLVPVVVVEPSGLAVTVVLLELSESSELLELSEPLSNSLLARVTRLTAPVKVLSA